MEKYFHSVWAEITFLEVGSQKDRHLHERVGSEGETANQQDGAWCLILELPALLSSWL